MKDKPRSSKQSYRTELKLKRKKRIRKKLSGTDDKPRLSIFKTSKHVYCQVINDLTGSTLVSASTFEKNNRSKSANAKICEEIGKAIAKRCLEKKIERVVFDKNGNDYHGRIKAIADGARSVGLSF